MSDGPAVRVRGLSYCYAGRPAVLHNLDFSIAAGERVGLVGPNGAGKTTLLLCLCGAFPVPAGVAEIAGLDPGIASAKAKLPTRAGIVFPDSDDQLFCATVLDDVAFGPLNLGCSRAEAMAKATDAIARVGLSGCADRPPLQLSAGQKRRAALAGVLAMGPEVLLFDEPTIFLDPRGRRDLVKLLNGLPGTFLIAAHDLDFIAATCGRVLLMDEGRIVVDGSANDVLNDEPLLARHGLERAL